jgi:Polysaccharide biosynthesis enzyme WcbI
MSSVVAEATGGAIASEKEPLREWHVLGRLEKTAIGTRGAGGVTSVRRREPAGCLLFGPYWQLRAGSYRLSFRCRPGKPRLPSEPVLGVEVIAMNRVQLAWLDLTAAELHDETGSLDFAVPPILGLGAGDEARLEFRLFHLGNAELTITAVDLRGIENEETHSAPPRTWRMLGRLDGGRPLLQLPAGYYRLEIRGEAGTRQMPAAPVLGVEITARRRWQDGRWWSWNSLLGLPSSSGTQLAWRDFTCAELRCGAASFDFEVPAELGLEASQDIVIGVQLHRLGNAGLTVKAVDVRQISEAEATLARREWRLLGRISKARIGIREADRATVRHSDPAGRFLYGNRPRLRLPRGRYRLSFCCRAGQPRMVSQPVLGVEVIARNRTLRIPALNLTKTGDAGRLRARCEFTAEALARDWASLDFDVPPELGCESKDEVGFEFRFLHLGNADLTVSAVNLHEIGGEDPPAKATNFLVSPQRTRVLIVGNCQAQTVHEALVRSGEFHDRLDVKYHFVALQQNLLEQGKAELETSDVLLVQEIKDWEYYPLRPHIRDDVRIIKFPLLHFASLWPFDHYNGPGDKEAYEREWPNLTFLYHDGLLARLRKEIPDRQERLLAYRTLSVGGIINFARLHDFEKRRLTAMDKQFGCEIGQFILANFQRRRLFYTTNHPNGQIIGMLMRYLLRQLGIDPAYPSIGILDHLKRLQVPVHPKVAEALRVKWADANTKYLYCGEQITWETYVRRYIEHYG